MADRLPPENRKPGGVSPSDPRLLPSPGTPGGLLYDNGTAWVALAPGSAGQLLQSNGAAAPVWAGHRGGFVTLAAGVSLIGFTFNTNEYFGIGSIAGLTSTNPDEVLPFVVPFDCTIKDLQLRSNSTSPASSTMEITLYKSPGGSNVLTYGATALVIPVGITAKYAEDSTHTVTATKGDCLLFRINEPFLTTGLIIAGRLVPAAA